MFPKSVEKIAYKECLKINCETRFFGCREIINPSQRALRKLLYFSAVKNITAGFIPELSRFNF